ncbi:MULTISPECIES: hypothetical protein [Streptomyces]|uniref:Uncharacterized protein n=1 Tax=Streptomyces sp. 900129855 TaxID=3155129 RepID=A0ABV2ZY96_9ACTN
MTWDKTWGYRMLDDAPEVWIGYERAFFEILRHRVANFIEGILLSHEKKEPDDPYIRTVITQMRAVESTFELLAHLE